MQVGYEVRPSPIAGVGLFTTEDIPKGALVWKYSPQSVRTYDSEAAVRTRLAALSEKELLDFLEHAYCWEGQVVEILDDGKYWNHSKRPNTGNVPDDPDSSYALRDIPAGEELLDDYSQHDRMPWYEAICAEHSVMSVTAMGDKYD